MTETLRPLARAERAVFAAAGELADSVLLAPVALGVLAPIGLLLRLLNRLTRGIPGGLRRPG